MTKKPNFIIFITDQLRWDALGCNGNKVINTPNIDQIANEGTNFSRMHVATQVCMPNRASLMTGRYPSVHGLRINGNHLSKNAVTFVDVLNNAGYQTASIGKIHLQPMTKEGPFKWFDENDLGSFKEAWIDKNDYTMEQPHHYESEAYFEMPKPYYGFNHVDLVTLHRKEAHNYLQWLKSKTSEWEKFIDPKNQLAHNYSCPQAFRTPIPEELYPTTFIQEKTLNYFNKISKNDPFITFVSFPDPHHPFNPPGKYWDMYDPESFDDDLPFSSHENPIKPLKIMNEMYLNGILPKVKTAPFMASKRHIQESKALTAGMITMIDDAIGSIILDLKKKDLYDNTVIIFTSDHGDYLGDFSLMLKGPFPFEGVTKVPFIWSDPSSRKSFNSDALASTIDISSSILSRANVKPFWGIQGKSLEKNILGNNELRDKLIVEFHDNKIGNGFNKPAFVRSFLSENYKLNLYKDESFGELYNLKNDPNETFNLFNEPSYEKIKQDLIFGLVNEMMENMDKSPSPKLQA